MRRSRPVIVGTPFELQRLLTMKTLAIGTLLLLAGCFLAGCTVRVTDFTVISTKNQQATAGYAQGPRTTGESCIPVIFFPLGSPNLKTAIDNTIEKAGPGYDALVDGVVYYKNKSFIFGSVCYEVQGTPIKSQGRRSAGRASDRAWKLSDEAVAADIR